MQVVARDWGASFLSSEMRFDKRFIMSLVKYKLSCLYRTVERWNSQFLYTEWIVKEVDP
jgi:hypothetical protein